MYNWCCTLLLKVKGQNRRTRHVGFQVFYAHVVGSFQFLHFLSDAASGVNNSFSCFPQVSFSGCVLHILHKREHFSITELIRALFCDWTH